MSETRQIISGSRSRFWRFLADTSTITVPAPPAARCRRAFLAKADLVGADVLGYAAGLARCHVGFADGVEQRGFAVVDMAHNGDYGRARDFELIGIGSLEHFLDRLVGQFLFVAD